MLLEDAITSTLAQLRTARANNNTNQAKAHQARLDWLLDRYRQEAQCVTADTDAP